MNITVATAKANAVCPEGNDQVSGAGIRRLKSSTENGRSLHTSGFRMTSTTMYTTATETTMDTPHLRYLGKQVIRKPRMNHTSSVALYVIPTII